jgi:hypothetical protein
MKQREPAKEQPGGDRKQNTESKQNKPGDESATKRQKTEHSKQIRTNE